MENKTTLTALLTSFGMMAAGIFIGFGIYKGRQRDHFVTVRGLAEKKVVADQATWLIEFRSQGPDLETATKKSLKDRQIVLEFLKSSGFSSQEIAAGMPRVSNYDSGRQDKFTVNDSFRLSSLDVNKVREISGRSSHLLRQGVALAGWQNPKYFFSTLGSIKPLMIELATKDARRAAEKFAQDSGSTVGSIRKATQGYFSFRGENSGVAEAEQIKKIARVVVSVDYLIK